MKRMRFILDLRMICIIEYRIGGLWFFQYNKIFE
jgi:hypothetical protein